MLLLKKEHRYGLVLVKLEGLDTGNFTKADYGAVGYYIGKAAGLKNVVVEGVSANVSFDELKFLMSPQPVSGAVTMCHVVGVTPEAPTMEEALGKAKEIHRKRKEKPSGIHGEGLRESLKESMGQP